MPRRAWKGIRSCPRLSLKTAELPNAALHFRCPVRYVPSLADSMRTTTKRHSFDMQVKLGCDKNGKLTAFDIDFIVDNGAYMNIGIICHTSAALWMLSGSYNIPNVNALARLVYTNNPAGGAARGAGPPQITFALESRNGYARRQGRHGPSGIQADQPSNRVRASRPATFTTNGRSLSFATLSGPTMTGRGLMPAASRRGNLRRGGRHRHPRLRHRKPRGPGHGCGGVDQDDGLTVFCAVADPGEGNDSMLTQIASHVSGIPMEKIRLMTRDTDHTTGMGPAAGSRMTYVAGGSLILAIEQLKNAMQSAGVTTYEGLKKAGKPARYMGSMKTEKEGGLDPAYRPRTFVRVPGARDPDGRGGGQYGYG